MDPDLAGFIGLAALMVTLVAWLRIDMGGRMDRLDERMNRLETAQGERMDRLEATLAEHGERLIRIEAAQNELRERMDGPDAELRAEMHAVRADLAHINERMARTEGAVAGALGRPFPELMTRPADAAAAE